MSAPGPRTPAICAMTSPNITYAAPPLEAGTLRQWIFITPGGFTLTRKTSVPSGLTYCWILTWCGYYYSLGSVHYSSVELHTMNEDFTFTTEMAHSIVKSLWTFVLRLKLYSSLWHSLFSCDVGLIGDNSANVIWRHETEAKQPHYENWLLPCNQITMELMYIHCELYVIKEQ